MIIPKVLGVIPARGGSKGIKNKNITPLNGKPLISYTIESANKSNLLNDCIVSTESKQIAEIAKKYNGKVPFLRPTLLAEDETPTIPVLEHALLEYEKDQGVKMNYVMLLQPTAPFRTFEDIDATIQMMAENPDSKSLISVYEGSFAHPLIMYKRRDNKVVPYLDSGKLVSRRQTFEKVYIRNGAIYIMTRAQILEKKLLIGRNPLLFEMPRWKSINIDGKDDLFIAELLLKHENN